jgi:hypothetical protein
MNTRLHVRLRAVVALAIGIAITLTSAGPAQAGSPPRLSWAPATATGSYDYGTIDAGTNPAVETFTLRNSGGSGSSVLTIALSGSSDFTITSDTCTGTSLGPNKTCTVTVQYAPTVAGQTDTATLTATSNKHAARASHT